MKRSSFLSKTSYSSHSIAHKMNLVSVMKKQFRMGRCETFGNAKIFILCVSVLKIANSNHIIDTKTPIVILDNQSDANSAGLFDGSQFGYSLAYINGSHSARFWRTSGNLRIYGTIFIGAPNDKRFKNSGAVWGCQFRDNVGLRCDLISSISNQPTASESSPYSCKSSTLFNETENEQRIGLSLNSINGQLAACAPRWKMNGFKRTSYYGHKFCVNETAVIGACYVAERNDTMKVITRIPYHQRQSSFYRNDMNNKWLLYAQFGFSTHVTHTTGKESLYVGSPGTNAVGNFAEYLYDEDRTVDFNDNKEITGLQYRSYLGYSITSGITRGQEFFLASGAPRAENLLGVVILLLQRAPSNRKRVVGEQFGSYFGYSVTSVDLNGDGLHELLVGAPYQSADIKSALGYNTGCVFIYDTEIIFSTDAPQKPRVKLCPGIHNGRQTVSGGAKFGSAIANMGDINFDTFEDFAVGAPYDEDGVGSVFIYHGNSQPSFSTSPAQVVKGKSFEIPGLRAFGSSLLTGSNVDIDGNKTPDLAIGAFESRHLLVLRTKPTVKTEISVYFQNSETNGDIFKFLPTQTTLRVRTCWRHRFSVPVPRDTTLKTWVKFEIRLRDNEDAEIPNSFDHEVPEEQLNLRTNDCLDRVYQLKQAVSDDNKYSIAFRATLRYNETDESYLSLSKAEMPLFTSQNIQQQQFTPSQNFKNTFRRFNPYLPAPFTDSKEATLAIAKDNCDSDGRPKCSPDLKLSLQVSYGNVAGKKIQLNSGPSNGYSEKPLVAGDVDTLSLIISLVNHNETAYRPTLLVTLAMSDNLNLRNVKSLLQFEWRYKSGKQRQCENNQDSSSIGKNELVHTMICAQPLQTKDEMQYTWSVSNLRRLILKGESPEGKIELKVEAYPSSTDDSDARDFRVEKKFSLSIEENVNIKVKGVQSGAGQSQVDPEKSNVDVIQDFQIENSGSSSTAAESIKVELLVPTHVKIKEKLTRVIGVVNPAYQSDYSNYQCEGKFFDPATELENNNRTVPAEQITSRSTRSITAKENQTPPKVGMAVPEAAKLETSGDKNVVTLNGCNSAGAETLCETFTCFTDLQANSVKKVRLLMYLLPHTKDKLLSEDSTGVQIESSIAISYKSKTVSASIGVAERKFNRVERALSAWSVFLMAGGGGILLLLLLTFILFKCGFFRRKAKEQLQQLKRQTMMLSEMQQFKFPFGEEDSGAGEEVQNSNEGVKNE